MFDKQFLSPFRNYTPLVCSMHVRECQGSVFHICQTRIWDKVYLMDCIPFQIVILFMCLNSWCNPDQQNWWSENVTPRSSGYGNVTATYIRRSEITSRIYAKHQYRQESECGSKWCIIHFQHMITITELSPEVINITIILHHQNGAIARVQKYTYINSQKALTSLQKWNSRGTQGAWKDRALNGQLKIHATAAPLWSATGRIQPL